MTMPPKPSVAQATEAVRRAIEKHGRPAWVTHVPYRIRELVPQGVLKELLDMSDKSTSTHIPRAYGREAIARWCATNVFAIVSVRELAEIGQISESSVRNFIRERPELFKKTEGFRYEVRDPKSDREIDKRNQNTTINQQKRK